MSCSRTGVASFACSLGGVCRPSRGCTPTTSSRLEGPHGQTSVGTLLSGSLRNSGTGLGTTSLHHRHVLKTFYSTTFGGKGIIAENNLPVQVYGGIIKSTYCHSASGNCGRKVTRILVLRSTTLGKLTIIKSCQDFTTTFCHYPSHCLAMQRTHSHYAL